MAWKVKNPKTGETYLIEEQFSEEEQRDVARDRAIEKGYIPVAEVRNPKTGDQYSIDDRTLGEAIDKGYMTEDNYQTIAEIKEARRERAKEQLKGAKGAAIAAGKGFADIATYGFSDEIVGAYRAATELGQGQEFLDAYRQYRDIDRALGETAFKERPGAYIAGAAPAVLGTLGATAARAPTTAQVLRAGAAEGAVAGVGEAEEIEDIPKTAAVGAGLGTAASGIIPLARGIKSKITSKKITESVEDMAGKVDLDQAAEAALEKRQARTAAERQILREADTSSFNKFTETVDNETAAKLLTNRDRGVTKKSTELYKATKQALEDLGVEVTDSNLLRYRAYTKAGNVIGTIEDRLKGPISKLRAEQGEEFIERTYDRILRRDEALKEVTRLKMRERIPEWSAIRRGLSLISDAKPLAKSFDDRLKLSGKLSVERTLDSMSKKHNLYTVRLGDTFKDISALRREARELGLKETDIYNALDTGDIGNIPEEHIAKWRGFFENLREEANTLGIPIQKRENYVPHRRLGAAKYQRALERRVNDIENRYNIALRKMDNAELEKLRGDKLFNELENEVNFLRGEAKDAEDFSFKINSILAGNKENTSRLATDAFAAKAREGEIPDFVKDREVGNLAAKWVQTTFRHAALRDGVDNILNISDIAQKAGDEFTSKYLKNLAADIVGSRTGTLAAESRALGNKFLTYALRKAETATDPISKRLWEGAGYFPEIMNAMARQVYPNYIGMNPKSVLQNLAQPMLMNIPDIGYRSGIKAWSGAQIDLARVLKRGLEIKLSPEMARVLGKRPGEVVKTRNINTIMQNEGLLPKQWTGEMVDALKDSLKQNAVTDMSRQALDKYTNIMMFAFEKSEIYARATSYFMGKRLATDLVASPDIAKRFINQLDSPAYRKSLAQAVRTNDLAKVERQLIDYINSNNMFNYDRMNMSEYGRFLGPLFSVFSKWPTSIAGRIIQTTLDQGAVKGGTRVAQTLLVPFMALGLVDYLTKPDDSALYNKLVGRNGLAGWTPADSVSPLLEGGIITSPAFQSAGAMAKAIRAEDSPQALYRWVNDLYATFGFGAGALRFFGEDLPIYRGNPKPTGPKIERRLKEINKQLQQL